ncbi:MAG: cytochrome c class [Bryobacterales bacterium]|nr:cytochrome c class [Bryobacterales bacterium]
MPGRRRLRLVIGALSAAVVVCTTLPSSGRAQTAEGGGQALFEKRCGGCHAVDRDKEGPRLGGVYGRPAASAASFGYSEALKKSKITWNAETLDRWLTDPDKLVPGNDMSFHVEKPDERREIIAYLKQTSGK